MHTANIIGSGPNGLAAAITLARAGVRVTVYERNPQIGGACSTAEVTLPGFHHDLGASAFPMGIASPFFNSLPLADYGFQWLHPQIPLAHPLDHPSAEGTAAVLYRNLPQTAAQLGEQDGKAWSRLLAPTVAAWPALVPQLLGPVLTWPRHPLALARFGLPALLPATTLARHYFRSPAAQALFAGCAAHSVMPLEAPLSSSVGIVLAAAAHANGWPVAAGGAQSLTNALAAHLRTLGGTIIPAHPVASLTQLPPASVTLFDTSTRALASIAADRLSPAYLRSLSHYKQGPGAFKLDWALSAPIPWIADACRHAGTIHLGGTLAEIAASEHAATHGSHSDKPFVLLVQPSIADPTRAPAGQHTAWAYVHVPNGSTLDRTDVIESQVERFAPGFRDCILARRTQSPAQFEAWNPNLLGGDLSGGLISPRQLLFRPTPSAYRTSSPTIFLASASTPPGGGVHGMCGFHAASAALQQLHSLREATH